MFPWAAFVAILAASLAALSLGLDVGMISSTLVQPTFISYFNHPSPSAIGGIVSAFSAGACIGAFGCAWVGDRFGRVWALRVGAIIALIGTALQAGSVHIAMLIIGRLINGFGAGMLTATFPVYASEVAPPSIRGSLGGLQMMMIEAAIFIATATGYGFGKDFQNTVQWRGPLAVQAIPVILLLPISILLPESPRWLTSKGKEDKAKRVLELLHKGEGDAFIQGEFQEIHDQVTAENNMLKPTWMEIARKPSWRRRIFLSAGLQIFAQLSGANCVQYYAATIYEQLGFSTIEALRLNLLFGAFGFIFSIFWVVTLDKIRRVRLLVISECMVCAALLVQAILSGVYADKANPGPNALRAQVAMFFVYNLFFIAIGMLSWLIPPEMCPMIIRAKANSISVSVNNIAGIVVAEISPIALSAIGFKFFFVFVACDIVAAFTFYFCYPETSQLTIEEMDVQFGDQLVDHVLQTEIVASHPGRLASVAAAEAEQGDVKTNVTHIEYGKE